MPAITKGICVGRIKGIRSVAGCVDLTRGGKLGAFKMLQVSGHRAQHLTPVK